MEEGIKSGVVARSRNEVFVGIKSRLNRSPDEMAPDMSTELDSRCSRPSVPTQNDHLLRCVYY